MHCKCRMYNVRDLFKARCRVEHPSRFTFGVLLAGCSHSTSEQSNQEDGGDTSTNEEDKCNFMDFPAREVAEQLTRLDAVGVISIYKLLPSPLWVFHCRLSPCVSLRSCLSTWCRSTAWAASGLSGTRRKTGAWRPPSAPPSPSSTPSPTASSPPSSARPLLAPPPPHLTPPPPRSPPPPPRTPLAALIQAPPTERTSSRGGSLLLRLGSFKR